MTVPPLLVLGNVNLDLVLGEIDGWPAIGTEIMVDRAETRAGGSAGNTALALTGLGVPHLLISSIGGDPNGARLRGEFDPASSLWIEDEAATTLTVGIVHKGGDRVFFTTPGHLQSARAGDLIDRLPPAPADGAFAILSGGFLMPDIEARTAAILSALAGRGWRTAIDPGWPPPGWTAAVRARMRDWLGICDCALLNMEEVAGLTGISHAGPAMQAARDMMRADAMLVVKTGAEGVEAHAGGRRLRVAAPRVTVIDTVGAGDTFNAAFLAGLVAGAGIEPALRQGVAAASRAISTYPRRYAP